MIGPASWFESSEAPRGRAGCKQDVLQNKTVNRPQKNGRCSKRCSWEEGWKQGRTRSAQWDL